MHIATHALDGAHGFLHQVATVAGRGGGVFRGLGGADRVTCHFFDGAGHFVDCRGGLLDLVVLLGQAAGTFIGHAVEFFGSGGQLSRGT
ncbi:hypothetical protein D3C81_2131460 [compost metagenome]